MSDKTIDRLTERAEIDNLRAINADLLEACQKAKDAMYHNVRHEKAYEEAFDSIVSAIRLAEGQP